MSFWCERRDNRTAHDGNDGAKGRQWTASVRKTTALAALFALWPQLFATLCHNLPTPMDRSRQALSGPVSQSDTVGEFVSWPRPGVKQGGMVSVSAA